MTQSRRRSAPAPRSSLSRRVAADFPATVVLQLTALEASLGGRAEIVGMLALAPLTPDLRYILGLLGDPACSGQSLAAICAIAGVLPGELLQHLAGAALLVGKVQAQQKIGAGIAAVAEDVMRRAAPYTEICSTCRGTGSITLDPTPAVPNPSPGPCAICWGVGKLTYPPDLERQQLAIEMAQLLPKSGGINIALQQNNGAGAGGAQGTLEALTALTDRILYGEDLPAAPEPEPEPEPEPAAPVVEAVVVETEP